MFMIVSKLPQDLLDVMHILPFWYTYLYWLMWFGGIALVLILLVFMASKIMSYLQSLPSKDFHTEIVKDRRFSKIQLRRDLRILKETTVHHENFRMGLHRMSSLLKTYFEISLKIEIEEMTAQEIKIHVTEKKELGHFFTELTVAQYHIDDPSKDHFIGHYDKAIKLIQ